MRYILVIISFLLLTSVRAQSVKLVSATQQRWAGGVAGSQGNIYSFTLKIDNKHKQVKLSSVWVDEQEFDIADGRNTVVVEALKDGRTVRINVRTSSATKIPGHTRPPQPAPIAYKGVALIGYKVGNKAQYFVVKKVAKQLQPLSYP